jgi:predicted ferric reductase
MHTSTVRGLITGFFVLNFCAILAIWYTQSGYLFTDGRPGNVWIALGRLTGLLAQAALLVQILLIARISFIEHYFGHDKMNKVHRNLGFWLLAFFLSHPVLLLLGYAARTEQGYAAQFMSFINDWHDVGNAVFGVLLMVIVALSSLKLFRARVRYETWYGIHFLTYIGVFMVFGHQTNNGDVSDGLALTYWLLLNGVVGALFLLYRWIRPIYMSRKHQFRIEKLVQEAPGITSLYITGKDMKSFQFEAGQYAHIRFYDRNPRSIMERLALLFPHPFSFSKAYDGTSLRFTIKSLGDFSQLVSTLTPGTRVTIAGPLGRFTKRAAQTDKFLLIAGGIGITPLRALAEQLNTEQKDVVLLYSARTKADLALVNEIKAFTKVKLICCCGDATPEEAPAIINGMLDAARLKELVPDLLDRDAYVCGPPAMMDGMIAALHGHGVSKGRIHFEKFTY